MGGAQSRRTTSTSTRAAAAVAAVVVLAAACTSAKTSVSQAVPAAPVPLDQRDTAAEGSDRDPSSGTGRPWSDVVEGVLTFRGNPTRTYYGEGPVPMRPVRLWTFPDRAMCSESSEGDETRVWCGTGWTGQPAVWERDGHTWVAFGAYDRAVHVLDGETGERLLPDFLTGDIIKGSVTVDPDGYPLLYTGSRDGKYRALAFDRDELTELWHIDAHDVAPTMWNDDWDGSGLVIDDVLLEGGENSRFHAVRLHRTYGADKLVTVDPEIVFHTAGWDDELLSDIGDRQVSIENSVAVYDDVVYFSNSGGLVQGWDISSLLSDDDDAGAQADGHREPERVFRYWAGDDTDASIVVDDDGMLYVAVEFERHTARSAEIGQLLKLDPSADEPLVWSVRVEERGLEGKGGFWATPALHRDLVIAPTHDGRILGVDRETGVVRWEKDLPGPLWQSPVIVDDVLVQGDCEGVLHGFDVSNTKVVPPELWEITLGGCIESTPVVWRGRIYVGSRGGYFHAVGDPAT